MKLTQYIILVACSTMLVGCSTLNPIASYEKKAIYYPTKQIKATPADIGLDYDEINLKTTDCKKINAWLVKSPEAKTTMVFLHGNAGNISHRLDKINDFVNLGLNVFIIDYRGYGLSSGTPSEKGLYIDAITAHDYIRSRNDLGNKVLVYGESLGGAVAIDVASKREVDVLMVESGFTSVKEMAKRAVPFIPGFLINTKMDSAKKIKKIRAPKLFIHSRQDEVIPFYMGKKLFDLAPVPKGFLEIKGGHNDGYLKSRRKYNEGIGYFLRQNRFL